jgi:hypothetical protein
VVGIFTALEYTFRMTVDALIAFMGVLVTLIPFLGFPLRIDNIILVVLGVIVIMLGIIVRRRGLMRRSAITKGNGTFVESVPRDMSEAHVE